eukprot:489427_1
MSSTFLNQQTKLVQNASIISTEDDYEYFSDSSLSSSDIGFNLEDIESEFDAELEEEFTIETPKTPIQNINCINKNNVLILIDWDDTIFPTSACRSVSELGNKKPLDIELVHKMCLIVYESLLLMIRLYGSSNIYIVSNADKLWIEKCLNQLSYGYFINIYHLISLYNIQIISSKNKFSHQYPNDSYKWKQLTFEYLVKKHYNKYNVNTVVSIGDSEHEYIASKCVINRLNSNNNKILLHRIKLLKNPSLTQLIEQYELIKKITYLFQSETNEIDIDYFREMKYYKNIK